MGHRQARRSTPSPLHSFRSYRGIAQLRAAITSFDHRTRRIMRAHHHLLM